MKTQQIDCPFCTVRQHVLRMSRKNSTGIFTVPTARNTATPDENAAQHKILDLRAFHDIESQAACVDAAFEQPFLGRQANE